MTMRDDSAFTSRGFAPQRNERDAPLLRVDGAWPATLEGTLYRIGPNPQFDPIPPYNPLLGDGMVHAFQVAAGRIAYRNRWVRTRQWELEHAAGRALFATSGDPRQHDPSVAALQTDGVANTNLLWHAGRLLALEEGHLPIELEPQTLETIGPWDFHGRLGGNMTGHPKRDPETGELVFFSNEPDRRFDGTIAWYVADPAGRIVREGRLRAPHASIVHDFAVTRRHLVFMIGPVTISLARARAGGPPLAWESDRPMQIAVVPRQAPDDPPRWLRLAPCFAWHVLNAWDRGDAIVLDVCEQAAAAFPRPDGTMTERADWRQYPCRWELDPVAGHAASERLIEEVCEYPNIDARFAMGPQRHGFFACRGGPGTGDPFQRGIGHFDFATRRFDVWDAGPSCAVSEPVFVPRSATSSEGDGYLLCLVYDEIADASCLAVLDAGDVGAGPVARAWAPHRVPMGFHGMWRPS